MAVRPDPSAAESFPSALADDAKSASERLRLIAGRVETSVYAQQLSADTLVPAALISNPMELVVVNPSDFLTSASMPRSHQYNRYRVGRRS